jgi:hypothetical protein
MILKFVYTLFVGVLLATLVGVGIAAFYEGPKEPDYPARLKVLQTAKTDSKAEQELIGEQEAYDKKYKSYQILQQKYNMNVSIISLISALIILIVSLTLFKKILMIADGVLLGGVLTLIYSIIRGFDTGDNKFRFIVVAVGFIVSIVLGYIKFIKTQVNRNA